MKAGISPHHLCDVSHFAYQDGVLCINLSHILCGQQRGETDKGRTVEGGVRPLSRGSLWHLSLGTLSSSRSHPHVCSEVAACCRTEEATVAVRGPGQSTVFFAAANREGWRLRRTLAFPAQETEFRVNESHSQAHAAIHLSQPLAVDLSIRLQCKIIKLVGEISISRPHPHPGGGGAAKSHLAAFRPVSEGEACGAQASIPN